MRPSPTARPERRNGVSGSPEQPTPPGPPREDARGSAAPAAPQAHETRIGLVLYGGVALAVYINGVVEELFRLATDAAGPYAELRKRCGTDVVIDIISGTSAGGINGAFLAKALTQGATLGGLKALWKRDADIEKLLRGPKDREPLSLLSSEYYHAKLLEALSGMKGTGRSSVDELDLFVTATDFAGQRKTFKDGLGEPLHVRDHRRVTHLMGVSERFRSSRGPRGGAGYGRLGPEAAPRRASTSLTSDSARRVSFCTRRSTPASRARASSADDHLSETSRRTRGLVGVS